MELQFKKTSEEARKAMCQAAVNIDHASQRGFEEIKLAQDQISKFTNHDHVKIVNSGNSAIFGIMSAFKGRIMIPDQGGWIGFKNIAEFLGLKTTEVQTRRGSLILKLLQRLLIIISRSTFYYQLCRIYCRTNL